ncbi:MAG: helix-turn-helix domain-containing protein [Phycisphaerales bacterium]|nr:helix-turn-helix domain-containing protein [Phycisphaerales bacterium]MCI0631744.1 helix-turn-helix domain-containing protein [Phycisphaerales bacterium]MCI0677402.1 helix-turn-helix domain-containing protein [Phycisphaerales bacterium]
MGTRGPKPQHDISYRKLRKLLRQSREGADLTQRALGNRLKKPHTYVHKTETGDRRIDPIELARWCLACDVDPIETMRRVVNWL